MLEYPVVYHAFVVLRTGQVASSSVDMKSDGVSISICLKSAATSLISVLWWSMRADTAARPRRSMKRTLASSTNIRTSGPARLKIRRNCLGIPRPRSHPHSRTAPAYARPTLDLPPLPLTRYASVRQDPPCRAPPERRAEARRFADGGRSASRFSMEKLNSQTAGPAGRSPASIVRKSSGTNPSGAKSAIAHGSTPSIAEPQPASD